MLIYLNVYIVVCSLIGYEFRNYNNIRKLFNSSIDLYNCVGNMNLLLILLLIKHIKSGYLVFGKDMM